MTDYEQYLIQIRAIILDYLESHDPRLFHEWIGDVTAYPDAVVHMTRAFVDSLQDTPQNDPAQYKRGLFDE